MLTLVQCDIELNASQSPVRYSFSLFFFCKINNTPKQNKKRSCCHIINNENNSTTNSTVFLYYFKAGVLRCHQRTDGNFEVFSSTSSGSLVEKHKRRCFTSRSCRLPTQGSRPLDPATMSTTVRRKWNRIGRIE